MRHLLIPIALLLATATTHARPKKPRRAPPAVRSEEKRPNLIPPPGYKGTNEGAQGRKNATEDAARAAEGASPDFRRF